MTVQILLSTYNGEKYISQQIDSLLSQSYSDLDILIRDDGSNDGTLDIIEMYMSKYPLQIRLIRGKNIGVINSFFELLKEARTDAKYYSFCDQDDIWKKTKVEVSILKLVERNNNKPLLFCSATQLTDSKLKEIKVWPQRPGKALGFYNALVENVVVGATITINRKARDGLIKCVPDNENIIMHDWWIYLCISAFGEIIYESDPTILYRQHESNVVGGNKTFLDILLRKFMSFSENRGRRLLYKQALEFWKCYGDKISGENKEQLRLFLDERESLVQKLVFLKRSKLYRQNFFGNMLFKMLVMVGYI
ncbi:glycosyltransferase family 2 protein [Paenibacillus sp. FSL L8-0463]|uniref:glycosyltransferase family 2 protein n=1 Tax=Paenibacillus sp. FSL L8-0463 TaxID=2954687 RepID=UPI0031192AE2